MPPEDLHPTRTVSRQTGRHGAGDCLATDGTLSPTAAAPRATRRTSLGEWSLPSAHKPREAPTRPGYMACGRPAPVGTAPRSGGADTVRGDRAYPRVTTGGKRP